MDILQAIEERHSVRQYADKAINQQKFMFELSGDEVFATVYGFGFYVKTDLGIAKYHFEVASGRSVK